MKNLFAYDFTNNTIVASKATLKKAGNPTTPEYKALMKMIAEQPTFKVVEKTINTKSGKTTYKGLTIEMMESYIDDYFRKVPEYYPEMYQDGFTPEEIMYAFRK